MDNESIEMQARTDSRRALHVLNNSSHDEKSRSDQTRAGHKIWVGAVVTLFLPGLIGLVVNNNRANIVQQSSPERVHFKALADQLSSGAQSCDVLLRFGRDRMVLEVRDTGNGFEPNELRGSTGLGLESMRERLRSVSGKLRVDSAPHRGTNPRRSAPQPHSAGSSADAGWSHKCACRLTPVSSSFDIGWMQMNRFPLALASESKPVNSDSLWMHLISMR